MNRAVSMPSRVGKDTNSRIEFLIGLIDELTSVVVEENSWLAQGQPASRSKQIARKTELAESFEKWVGDISAKKISVQTTDEKLRVKFTERIERLKLAMDENIIRLRAAIEASRRRIEAVMSAIREQVADAHPYTSSGRLSRKSASFGTNIRA
jgi:hypothetical protein